VSLIVVVELTHVFDCSGWFKFALVVEICNTLVMSATHICQLVLFEFLGSVSLRSIVKDTHITFHWIIIFPKTENIPFQWMWM